ncbi:glycosyltransferase family 10 domain-containing protein [Salegentibacter chungangensis]|uniref:Glycosyltransferase family 10 domain-containing protein n=1 Tax=Salegentibacter chungangensis TaxID=1335724 RepID=A0ABW3NTR2_9FLAO
MQKIKLWFTDFYEGFEIENNYFFNLLKKTYNVELDQRSPDYLIYSCYGSEFLKYNCIRIYYTGENLVPDFNLCDYAIGFHYLEFHDRYLRFPNFALFKDQFKKLIKPLNSVHSESISKEHFCNFIYANSEADPARDDFFNLLNKYKKVSSPGRHLNNLRINVGERFSKDWMYTKIQFQSSCKFSIAFENSSSPGYTTEKLLHAFISNTIPIYWGNPEVTKDFNPKAFIICHEYPNFEEVVKKIKEIDNDDELFISILNEPPFRNNSVPDNLKTDNLNKFLANIFDQELSDAFRRPNYGTTRKYENNLKGLVKLKNKMKPVINLISKLKN